MYGCTVKLDRVCSVLSGEVYHGLRSWEREDGIWVRCESRHRPEVDVEGPGDPIGELDRLVTRLLRLDARNVSRDRVFEDRCVVLELLPYEMPRRNTQRIMRSEGPALPRWGPALPRWGLALHRVTLVLP